MSEMHKPSAEDLLMATKVKRGLEDYQRRVLDKEGACAAHIAAVLSAAHIDGWLYVASHSDEVRHTFKEMLAGAALCFTRDGQEVPLCITALDSVKAQGGAS